LTLQGVMSGAGTPWSFETANTASQSQDKLAVWAVFTDTSVTTAPLGAGGSGNYWVGTSSATGKNVVSGTPQNAGGVAGSGVFVTGTTGTAGYKTMTNMHPFSPGSNYEGKAHLYLNFTLPSATTDTNPKLITFVLTAHN
jgi:hypothetical protein